MPEMDGFEAVRRLREMEQGGRLAGHLPVIALTASAVKGDRERCVEAGMDAYLSKPFEADTLLDAMGHLLATQQEDPAAEPPAKPQPLPFAAPGVPRIAYKALVKHCMDDVDFALELLGEFEKRLAERVDEIGRHAREGNLTAIAAAAHGLKGVAATVTAEPVRALAAKLESSGKAGDLSELASLVDQLRHEAQRCLRYIPELRQQTAAS
jgi:two-component system, sensor histidine kinase and response regulator